MKELVEYVLLKATRGAMSRLRLLTYRFLGMKMGTHNRMEGHGRVRRCSQIELGSYNAFTQGSWLWPNDVDYHGIRIRIGSQNYFNRNVMIDACGLIEIGDQNMFGPDVYITDSNHRFERARTPQQQGMDVGRVKIGSGCWIGARSTILKDVELADGCVVGAGSVVTRSVPAGTVVAGVPARPIGDRTVQPVGIKVPFAQSASE